MELIAERVSERVIPAVAAAKTAHEELSADRRLLLRKPEAAEALAMSPDHFRRHVLPDLRMVRSGSIPLIPVSELHEWIDRNASRLPAGGDTTWTND